MCAKRKPVLSILFVVVGLAVAVVAAAQQPTKVPRIGFLTGGSATQISARVDAFRHGLRELGYIEGKNIIIEWRYSEGNLNWLKQHAAELVRLKVNVIVTAGTTVTSAAKEATATNPVVMAQDPDPVGNGFVASLSRPGENITGLSRLAPEISGKQLELLKETVPRLLRVDVLGDAALPGQAQILKEVELAAAALKVKSHFLKVQSPKDIETAFRSTGKRNVDAIVVLETPLINSHRSQIAALAAKSRLPAMYMNPEYVEDGGLMSYGASIAELYRRAAVYVDKILKGAKPGDLPVEQPTKFELVINLKTAKQIGLTIPQKMLARADKVIQ